MIPFHLFSKSRILYLTHSVYEGEELASEQKDSEQAKQRLFTWSWRHGEEQVRDSTKQAEHTNWTDGEPYSRGNPQGV